MTMVVVGTARGRSGNDGGGGGSGGGGGGGSGSGGGGGLGSTVEEGKVCSVAWQRQHLHHQQHNTKASIKLAAQGGDALPVVELKPFTKKVWRREKSLPNFYDKPPVKEEPVSETARNPRNGNAPPDIVRYIRELSDQQKTVDTRQSADSTQRYRSKLHPKTDFSFEGWSIAEHQQDIIPSFISRQERTKTVLAEDAAAAATSVGAVAGASSGSNAGNVSDRSTGQAAGDRMPAREVSNLMATYTRDKPLQQQQVCLTGDKLSMANLGRRQLTYLNPFSAYRQRQPWNAIQSDNHPASLNPRHNVSLANSSGRVGGHLAVSANGYLPRRDLVLSGSSFHNPERAHLQPLKTRYSSSPHKFNSKLGSAQDALLALSRSGAPTVVERNLFFDQEVRLERCRRERSFAAVNESNIMSTAHYVAYDSQPTRGEINLMRAREANKLPEGTKVTVRRNGLQKPLGPLPPFGQPHANLLRHLMDDSPRSVQSDVGDSGIRSSPGDDRDWAARADLPEGPGVILREATIPEQPADSEDPERSPKEGPGADVELWAQKDNLVVLPDAGDDLEESTEEYRRPLSDSAATDAVHIRNELTPMSAENRARLLPRDDSYLETVDSERALTSHRKHREGFVTDAKPPHGVVDKGDTQELTQPASGAETTTNDSLTTKDKQTGSLKCNQHVAQTESEQERNQAVLRGKGVSESISPAADKESVTQTNDSVRILPSGSAALDNALFRVVRSSSGTGQRSGGHASKLAGSGGIANDIRQTSGRHVLEFDSVNSSAPSNGTLDSSRRPISQPPSTPLPGDSQEAKSNAEAEKEHLETKADSRSENDVTKRDTTSETVSGKSDNGQASKGSQMPNAEATVVQKEQENRNEDSPKQDSKPEDLPSNDKKLDQVPMENEKNQSPTTEPEPPAVLDSERNVSKTALRDEDIRFKSSSRSSSGREGKSSPSSSVSSASSSKSSRVGLDPQKEKEPEGKPSGETASEKDSPEEKSSEAKSPDENSPDEKSPGEEPEKVKPEGEVDGGPVTQKDRKWSAPSCGGSKDTVKDNPVQSEDGSKNVETIVTVTMEPVQNGDNFDGSKTFLTSTNVESEEWQNLVKV